MPKILVAECKQEVSSFNPVPSDYHDFVIRRGAEFFDYHHTAAAEVRGALDVFATDRHYEPVPIYSARAITSGGTLGRASFERIADEFLGSLRRSGSASAAYFALHGAMSAEGEGDPEGFLLEESRRILGEDIPIIVSLDLHGILTDRMLRHSDAIVAFHTYPHVDFYETGARAARTLMQIVEGRARPVTVRVKIPMLVRGDELITATGVWGGDWRGQVLRRGFRGMSAAVMIGNPFTDVPALRTNSLAVANGDSDSAVRCATQLASQMWERRAGMQASLTGVAEAVRLAGQTHGTAVLMDAADATSSGASGDGNAILREVAESGFEGRVLAPLVDPPAVKRAFAAGVGGAIRARLGGSLDPARFRPLATKPVSRCSRSGIFEARLSGGSGTPDQRPC